MGFSYRSPILFLFLGREKAKNVAMHDLLAHAQAHRNLINEIAQHPPGPDTSGARDQR